MSAITLYSEDWPERATLDPTQKQAAYALRELYRRQPPGGWSDNRMEQAQHFKGVIHCAISAIMDLMLSASFEAQKRRRPRRNRTTFGKSSVAKSMGQSQHQGRDEEYEPLEDYDHPLARVLYQPNPNETMAELAVKLVQQNRLTGVGPLWAIPNDEGQPVQLWALKTPLIQPIWQLSKQYPYGAWRVLPYAGVGWMGYTPPGFGTAGAILPGEQVRRWLCPHPLIDWDGFSPLTAGAVQLDVLESIDDSRKSAMDNGLQLDAMLIAPGMEQSILDRIVAQMTEKHGGARNARKFAAIAPAQSMTDRAKLETYGTTPREMDYNQSWDQMIKFALALFGVPAPVAGLADTTSYSELFASIRQFHARQSAYFVGFETWLTKTLAWPYCDEPGEYQVRVKLPPVDDPDLRHQQMEQMLKYDLLSFNEARAMNDKPTVEGGDVPRSVYVQMKQQAAAPQPAPGALPGADESAPVPTSDDGQNANPFGQQPTAGAVPGETNPQGQGTRPPLQKAMGGMGSMTGSAGGFLVPPQTAGRGKMKKRRRLKHVLNRTLKALGG